MKVELWISAAARAVLEEENLKTAKGEVLSLVMTGEKLNGLFLLGLGWYNKGDVEAFIVQIDGISIAVGLDDSVINFDTTLLLDLDSEKKYLVIRELDEKMPDDSNYFIQVPVQPSKRVH